MAHRREPSPLRSRYIEHHNAHPTQGVKRLGLDWEVEDQLRYHDSDPDKHGQHPRVRDAQRSLSPGATKKIWQTPFSALFRVPQNIIKYSVNSIPAVWLEDFHLVYQVGSTDEDLFIIQYLLLYLAESA